MHSSPRPDPYKALLMRPSIFPTPGVPPIPCVYSTLLQPRNTDVAFPSASSLHTSRPGKGSTCSPRPVLSRRIQEGAPLSGRPHSGGAPQGAHLLPVSSTRCPGPRGSPAVLPPGSPAQRTPSAGTRPPSATRLALWPGGHSRRRSQAVSGSSPLDASAPPNENHGDRSKQAHAACTPSAIAPNVV